MSHRILQAYGMVCVEYFVRELVYMDPAINHLKYLLEFDRLMAFNFFGFSVGSSDF
jgi:hypothetical protein